MAICKDCRPLLFKVFWSRFSCWLSPHVFSCRLLSYSFIVFLYCFVPKDKGRMRGRDNDFLLVVLFYHIEMSLFLYNIFLPIQQKWRQNKRMVGGYKKRSCLSVINHNFLFNLILDFVCSFLSSPFSFIVSSLFFLTLNCDKIY